MPKTAKRLYSFTESVIREMTRIAHRYNAINLSQGFPDADPPRQVIEAAIKAMHQGPHQYAVTWGAPKFRQALVEKQRHWMGVDLHADEHVVVTCGSTEAMMVALMTVCDPGDKVIIFSPYYENYGADTILSGADPIYVPLEPPGFHVDPSALRDAFKQRPKALVLCNPSNPCGKVFSREELSLIAELAKEFDSFIITDEVYEHIVYPPQKHCYMATLPDMFGRTISCSSLSKTYNMTGWRLGYIIAAPEIIAGARKIHDFLTVGAAAPLQEAATVALRLPGTYYDTIQQDYGRKRDLFLGYLDRVGLPYVRPHGAYYVMVDCRDLDISDDVAFCRWMAKEIGVAAVPGSCFFHEPVSHFVRFHFARDDEILRAAGERLLRLQKA
ncbi:MAG: pyridoxal phosphate-dependent aminotransferase [Desulforhopalus sp.]